ncbi:hypothetical protein GCM10010400_14740 [Streptomyces aculeolatus]
MPSVQQPFGFEGPYVSAHGHLGGLYDSGELSERYGPIGPYHFQDQLTTFCSEHETDSNAKDRVLSAACVDEKKMLLGDI